MWKCVNYGAMWYGAFIDDEKFRRIIKTQISSRMCKNVLDKSGNYKMTTITSLNRTDNEQRKYWKRLSKRISTIPSDE